MLQKSNRIFPAYESNSEANCTSIASIFQTRFKRASRWASENVYARWLNPTLCLICNNVLYYLSRFPFWCTLYAVAAQHRNFNLCDFALCEQKTRQLRAPTEEEEKRNNNNNACEMKQNATQQVVWPVEYLIHKRSNLSTQNGKIRRERKKKH